MYSWLGSRRLEVLWVLFAVANFALLVQMGNPETVLFHLVWIGATIL